MNIDITHYTAGLQVRMGRAVWCGPFSLRRKVMLDDRFKLLRSVPLIVVAANLGWLPDVRTTHTISA